MLIIIKDNFLFKTILFFAWTVIEILKIFLFDREETVIMSHVWARKMKYGWSSAMVHQVQILCFIKLIPAWISHISYRVHVVIIMSVVTIAWQEKMSVVHKWCDVKGRSINFLKFYFGKSYFGLFWIDAIPWVSFWK